MLIQPLYTYGGHVKMILPLDIMVQPYLSEIYLDIPVVTTPAML